MRRSWMWEGWSRIPGYTFCRGPSLVQFWDKHRADSTSHFIINVQCTHRQKLIHTTNTPSNTNLLRFPEWLTEKLTLLNACLFDQIKNVISYFWIINHHHILHGLCHAWSVPSSWTVCWSFHCNCGCPIFCRLIGLDVKFFLGIRLSSIRSTQY
jgi:hypothetical protein